MFVVVAFPMKRYADEFIHSSKNTHDFSRAINVNLNIE